MRRIQMQRVKFLIDFLRSFTGMFLIIIVLPFHGSAAPTNSGCSVGFTNPFGCKFAFGSYQNDQLNSLDFIGTWVGDERNGGLNSWSASGSNNSCGDCELVRSVAGREGKFVVFYTYFIGFQACRQGGFCDCNTQDPPNLCTHASQWIRNNRSQLIRAYGEYARVVHQHSPNKPVIWWLEGDFIQYTYEEQNSPFSYEELGELARDIACAIKTNQPGAIVAMNHSPWISDDQMKKFWGAMPPEIDIVWLQGPGDSNVLNNSWAPTGCYDSLSKYSNYRPMMAETSYGTPDRWTTTSVENINARIAQGVFAVHFNTRPSSNDLSTIDRYRPQLNSTCTSVPVRRQNDEVLLAQEIVRTGNVLRYGTSHGRLCIISISGQQVLHQAASGHGRIDISVLPPGVYFARTGRTLLKFVR